MNVAFTFLFSDVLIYVISFVHCPCPPPPVRFFETEILSRYQTCKSLVMCESGIKSLQLYCVWVLRGFVSFKGGMKTTTTIATYILSIWNVINYTLKKNCTNITIVQQDYTTLPSPFSCIFKSKN